MMVSVKEDPRLALRKKFLKEIADKIGQETKKERRLRGGEEGEMEESEVFRIYSNEAKRRDLQNRLVKRLQEKDRSEKEKKEIESLLGKRIGNMRPELFEIGQSGNMGSEVLRIASLEEIRRLDQSQDPLFEIKGINDKKR